MPGLTNQLILHNIDTIFHAPNQGIHVSEFVNLSGTKMRDHTHLLAYLLKHDLVEIEDDPEVYYLTDKGYNVQESRQWYDPEFEDHNKWDEADSFDEEELPNRIKPPFYKMNPIYLLLIFAGLCLLYYFLNISSFVQE